MTLKELSVVLPSDEQIDVIGMNYFDRRPLVYYSGNLRMLGSAMDDKKIKNRTLGEMGVLIVEAIEEDTLQIIVNDAWTRL